MTDTRTAETTTPTTKTTSKGPSDADRRIGEADAMTSERAVNDRSGQPLTTADIAGDRAHEPDRADERERGGPEGERGGPERERRVSEREPGVHRSNLPEPTVAPLFSEDATDELRERWTDVQAGFVDEPKSSVEQADALVAEVMKRLADSFATERQALEQQWSRGDDASTEDLRVALRRYRSFFDRLLSI